MFFLKKLVSHLLLPLPVFFALLFSGLMLTGIARRKGLGKILIAIGTILLLLSSMGFIADRFTATLENRYPPLLDIETINSRKDIHWIVVLGGGTTPDSRLPLSNRLSDASLTRLLEGVRLQRELPGSRIILSGGNAFQIEPEGEILAQAALLMGVREDSIVKETEAWDTADQARRISGIVGKDRFILVTSAIHMPRAMYLFRKYSLNPLAAPTGYLVFNLRRRGHPRAFLPGSGHLRNTEEALHEYLGLIWARMQ